MTHRPLSILPAPTCRARRPISTPPASTCPIPRSAHRSKEPLAARWCLLAISLAQAVVRSRALSSLIRCVWCFPSPTAPGQPAPAGRRRTGSHATTILAQPVLANGTSYPQRGTIQFIDNEVSAQTGTVAVRALLPIQTSFSCQSGGGCSTRR